MFKNHSFHEAEVINYYIQDNNIYLDLEDVTNNDDKKVNGTFIFESIQDVEIDDIKSNDIRMYYADGEIIDLAQHGDSIMLIIRWFNYFFPLLLLKSPSSSRPCMGTRRLRLLSNFTPLRRL